MRKSNLIHSMVLVAATAIGLALARSLLQYNWTTFVFPREGESGFSALRFGFAVALTLTPIQSLWTIAALVLRLRGPCPPLRSLAQEPGLIASVVVVLTMVVGVANPVIATVIMWARHGWLGRTQCSLGATVDIPPSELQRCD
jgi:hypothetical protein